MRSLLVAVLFAHAEAQLPEDRVVPLNTTSATTSAPQHQQGEQLQQPPEVREKYMREYAGQFADFWRNDTFDADGQQSAETQAYYKNLYMKQYGDNYSQYMNEYGGNYSRYMNEYGGNYSRYMDEYAGGGSSGGLMQQYGGGRSSGGYGDYQKYMDEFVPAAYGDEGQQAPVHTTVNAFREVLAMVTTTTGWMEPVVKDALAAPADMGLGGDGNSSGSEALVELAEAPASDPAMEYMHMYDPQSYDYSKYMHEYGGNYSEYMDRYGGGGRSGDHFDYQKYIHQYTGNNSSGEDYENEWEKYGEKYEQKYGDWHKYVNEATTAAPQRNNSNFSSSEEAAALALPAGFGRSAWLVLCAFGGASIPVAFAAARRRQQVEADEESTRFLLMA